jgi:hypothetical protein
MILIQLMRKQISETLLTKYGNFICIFFKLLINKMNARENKFGNAFRNLSPVLQAQRRMVGVAHALGGGAACDGGREFVPPRRRVPRHGSRHRWFFS